MFGRQIQSIFVNRRLLAILCMGFSSGLPLMLTLSTLQAWFTQAGTSVITVGMLSLVGIPYLLKFLWAPFMDRFAPIKGGKRRGWILITQVGLCVALWVLAGLDPKLEPKMIGFVALIIAFFSASQDVSVDAYRADALLPEERGIGAAYYIFAYRMAILVSGALALVIADHTSWQTTYQIMAGLIALTVLGTLFAPNTHEAITPAHNNLWFTIRNSFQDLWRRDSIVLLLLFVVFYKLGDALASSLITTFLLRGLGFNLTEVGSVYKSASIVATIIGALIGGAAMVWLGMFRSLLIFGIAQAFSTLTFIVLAMIGKNIWCMAICVFIENFCSGMGTVAFMAFMMSLCHVEYTATQYACLSALASIGRVCLGPVAGVMVLHFGWVSFYAWSFAMSFPGLFLLGLLRTKVSFNAKVAEI
jgi:PAT family beta-lactamase induction signal transducer AmpG